MAQNDMLKRYLDAGMAFTNMTRDRAEAIVKDLVKAGAIRRKEAEQQIDELLERSRKNTEDLLDLIRKEVAEQLRAVGLDDLAKRAGGPAGKAGGEADKHEKDASAAAAKPAPAKKSKPSEKAAAQKSGPSKTASVARKELPAKKQAGTKAQGSASKPAASKSGGAESGGSKPAPAKKASGSDQSKPPA